MGILDPTPYHNKKNEEKQKSTLDCLLLLVNELRQLQLSLDPEYGTDKCLHIKLLNVCRGIPAYQFACFKPSDTSTGLINDLQSSIITSKENSKASSTQLFTDRCYHKNKFSFHNYKPNSSNQTSKPPLKTQTKRCYVCKRPGCWSNRHTKPE